MPRSTLTGDRIPLKPYAQAIEGCGSITEAFAVLERLLDAVRATPHPQDLSRNLGHFSDWLYEVRQKGLTLVEPPFGRCLEIIDELSVRSSTPPGSDDIARIRADLRQVHITPV